MNRAASPSPIYRALSLLLFLPSCLHAVVHGLRNREPLYLLHRLGLTPRAPPGATWLHAASVGEVNLVKPLADALLASGERLLVTTFTATGYRTARRHFPASVVVHAIPIDFLPCAFAFARRGRYRLGLVAETELWPETLYQVAAGGTRLLRLNARLSPRTLDRPAWVRRILARTLACFELHLTRSVQDDHALQGLGIAVQDIRRLGNLKFAQAPSAEPTPDPVGRPYLLFASSHAREEVMFARMYAGLATDLLAVIAPRHPQRADGIRRAVEATGLRVAQRSRGEVPDADTHVYLVDTLGELRHFMQHARLVVMGGSFNGLGGHNVLEPAALGCAVITGPDDRNIRADLDLLLSAAAIEQVADSDALATGVARLLADPAARARLGGNARAVVAANAGVLDAYLALLAGLR